MMGIASTTVELAQRTSGAGRRHLEIRVFANDQLPVVGDRLVVWQDLAGYVVEAVEPYRPQDDNEPPELRPQLTAWISPEL